MPGNLKFLNKNFFAEHQEGDFSWGKQLLSGLGKLDKMTLPPTKSHLFSERMALPSPTHSPSLTEHVLADLLCGSCLPCWPLLLSSDIVTFFRRSQSLCWSKAHCVFRPGVRAICLLLLCADLIRWFLRIPLQSPPRTMEFSTSTNPQAFSQRLCGHSY